MRHTRFHCPGRAAANATTATARLLAMLCILSVFIPTFILNEPVRSLFMPLDAGGGLRHDRLLPALQHARARAHRVAGAARARTDEHKERFFDRLLAVFVKVVAATVRLPLGRGAGSTWPPAAC